MVKSSVFKTDHKKFLISRPDMFLSLQKNRKCVSYFSNYLYILYCCLNAASNSPAPLHVENVRISKMDLHNEETQITKDTQILLEGVMEKKTGFFKLWKSRYFVLLDDLLCYFLQEEQKESYGRPTGRIFFSDTTSVDRAEKKGRPYSILITTTAKKHIISCKTYQERENWVNKIWEAKEKHKNMEITDPIRKKSTRLSKEYKRITIQKDPKHGIGCTIKNVGGAIYVSRIIPDGPVATSGALRPGDQIMDINGTRVTQCPIEKIKEILSSSPECVVCTVKPVTHYTSHDDSPQQVRQAYTEVDPDLLQTTDYMEVELVGDAMRSQSVEALDKQEALEKAQQHADYMNSNVIEGQNNKSKKVTNYAQLEFTAQR